MKYGIIKAGAALCMGAFLLSACSTSPAPPASGIEEPPMEITVGFWNSQDYLQGDAVQQYVEEKFNIKLIPVSFTYSDDAQRLQQLAVSDNLPDVFASSIYGSASFESWISHHKIRPLPKDLSSYPQLQSYMENPYNERFKDRDGYSYVIPRLTYQNESFWALDRCIIVRRDWMDNLGLEMPRTWEEFVDMLHAFVHDDPDGNGLDDTMGLTASHLNTLEAVYLGLFPELSNTERGWMYEDGEWIPVYASEKTGGALEEIRQLYLKGLLTPDFAYVSTNEAQEQFLEGKAGAIAGQYFSLLNTLQNTGDLAKAQDIIAILPQWPAPDGNRYRFTTSLHWSESYFGANVSDEKMDVLLSVYDWMLTDEWRNICQYGLEGTDWVMKDGHPVENKEGLVLSVKYPSLSVLAKLVSWNQDYFYSYDPGNCINFGLENVTAANEMLDWFRENTQRVNYNYDIIFMSTPAKNNLVFNREIQKEMVKVILGNENAAAAWPKVLDTLRSTTTLDDAIREVTRLAEELQIYP